MASKECMVISLLVVALISVIVVGMILSEKDEKVPCYFVFGDSLSDNGNNNNLETSIKANFSPYGHDFPNGPTGRFTNGKTMHDFLAEHFGIHDYIPPFAIAKDNESVNVTQGVNYASGWAGIRDESGQRLGVRIPLNEQLRNHKIIVSRISKKMGDSAAKKHLSECIYALQIGGNDYTDNFFQPEHYNTSHQYTQEQYATALVEQYSNQIKSLHEDGARKFAVFGLDNIGCTPYAIKVYGSNFWSGCADKLNEAADLFNKRLQKVVNELNSILNDAKLAYLNPSLYTSYGLGLLNRRETCCETENGSTGEMLCARGSQSCYWSTHMSYWDGHHHTEAWNRYTALTAYRHMLPLAKKK